MADIKLDEILTQPSWLSALQKVVTSQKDAAEYLGPRRPKTFPKRELTFASLNKVAPKDIKVLIFGQDPYPREASAVGVAFNDGEIKNWTDAFSPSFRNIIKNVVVGAKGIVKTAKVDELRAYLKKNAIAIPPDWFASTIKQGVCWLNTSLTFTSTDQTDLKRHVAFWKPIVDTILQTIVEEKRKLVSAGTKTGLVVILWGGHAKKLQKIIDKFNKAASPVVDIAYVDAPHPAVETFHTVLSFESANENLKEFGLEPVNWLPKAGSTGAAASAAAAPATAAAPKKRKRGDDDDGTEAAKEVSDAAEEKKAASGEEDEEPVPNPTKKRVKK